jgi:ferredoxin-like protein FixX
MEIVREAQHLKAAKQDPHARTVRSTTMSKVNPDLMQVCPSKIWFLVHNSRTSWTSKLRSTRMSSLSSRL